MLEARIAQMQDLSSCFACSIESKFLLAIISSVNEEEKKIAHINAYVAMGEYMCNYCVAIWQRHEEDEYVGSGTCIEIDARLFLSTAAHNFKVVPRGGISPARRRRSKQLRFFAKQLS